MRFGTVFALIVIISTAIILPVFFSTDLVSEAHQQTSEYAAYVQSATKAGVSAAMNYKDGENLFSKSEGRKSAVDAYYHTLVECFNYDMTVKEEMVKYYTPCIFLVDNDGFYIEYTQDYSDGTGHAAVSDIITPINKWAKRYDEYTVEYHLNDDIVVTVDNSILAHNPKEKSMYYGNYSEVYARIKEDDSLAGYTLSFLGDETKYREEKRDLIIGITQNKLEYYVNVHDEFFNQKNDVQYQFTLPKITGEEWGRLIDMPTVIGFLQGIQIPHEDTFLNVYSFSGHEMTEDRQYYLQNDTSGITYYHIRGCMSLSGDGLKGMTMTDAAKKGAFPCPYCIR